MGTTLWSQKIAFIGAGSMSEAIIRGLIGQKKANPGNVVVMNRQDADRLIDLQKQYGVVPAVDSSAKNDAIRSADIVVIAMKPKDVAAALKDIAPLLSERQLLVSVIAGMPIETMERLIPVQLPIVRTMPNTSSTIGLGATGLSFSAKVSEEQKDQMLDMFRSIGVAVAVEEHLLEIVTGVSGSGPAYIYYMMEAMIKAGVEGGLPEHISRELTVQTVLGAAQMVKTTMEDPAELRRKVTSPGGATQAAIEMMDRYHFGEAVIKAVNRSAERSQEMGAMISGTIYN